MKTYNELKALIERRGVHAEFGAVGEGWAIEQSPHELATFLVRMQELGVQSVLEIGTGYKGGLSRFLAQDMGWDVTTVDVQDYGHRFAGVEYIVIPPGGKRYPHFDRSFDLVFIDGNHSYDQVKSDKTVWGFHATKAIAFHDVGGLRNCEGVNRFWQEIALIDSDTLKPGFHIIMDFPDKQSGIGWIEL